MNQTDRLSNNFGLVAWLESTRVALPLKGVEARFQVDGAVVSVELDQIYHQDSKQPLDCTYTFPLPAGAAVYRCELHVNGRVIRAIVEETETAKRIYQEQKAAGRRAALVESERENVFTLSLGNTQPGDLIVVRFAWFQILDRAGDGLRLLIPTCPGVRYIPGKVLLRDPNGPGTMPDTTQVPDASRISPPRIDSFHPDAAYFSVEGRICSQDADAPTVSSPTHAVAVRECGTDLTVELASQSALPDRDFVLAWREPEARQLLPQCWRWVDGGETYALVQFRAPATAIAPEGYSQDFYFLVDRSGSMSGQKWDRTCDALHAFVGLLGKDDRVSLTLFESDFRDFAEAPMPAPMVKADAGFRDLKALGTGGGTELLPAVRHSLELIGRHSQGRRTSIIIVTDGQVGNEQEIMAAFRSAPAVAVHTFGIDHAVNDAFLRSLAEQQQGCCCLQTPNDDIAGTIATLGARLRQPVLTSLECVGAWQPARDRWPDLHAGEVVRLALRAPNGTPLEIKGRLPDGTPYHIQTDAMKEGGVAVMLLWAKQRIDALIAAGRNADAITLAKQSNLICEGTAFLAWDEAENVAVAKQEIYQPSLEAAELYRGPSAVMRAPQFSNCRSFPVKELVDVAKSSSMDDDALQGAPSQNERLVDNCREAMKGTGIPSHEVERIIAWAVAPNGVSRLAELCEATEAIRDAIQWLMLPAFRDLVRHDFTRACTTSPEGLLLWSKKTLPLIRRMPDMITSLSHARVPEKVAYHVLAWVLEKENGRADRLGKIQDFLSSMQLLPFSDISRARQWQNFSTSALETSTNAAVAIRDWIESIGIPSSLPTQRPRIDPAKLIHLLDHPTFPNERNTRKLLLVLGALYQGGPEAFKAVDNLTWPEGQAILLSSEQERIRKTNASAQIHQCVSAPYFVDTGHDTMATKRLLEMVMGKLGCEAGLTNRVRGMFKPNARKYDATFDI